MTDISSPFSPVFEKFIEQSPVTVMVQALLEQQLNAQKLDKWFDSQTNGQYTRDLLFSSVVAVMLEVVCQIRPSVHVAYQKSNHIKVSAASLYNKLNGMKTQTSAALVRHIGQETSALIIELKAENKPWLPGYRCKLLDGNCLESTERRLKVLRSTQAGALPGKSLVVFEPQTETAIDVFPCEDGHAQERRLLGDVLNTVEENDLWIADRNFCVQHFCYGIRQKKGFFIQRQHNSMPVEILTEPQLIGENESGKIYEQQVQLKSPNGETYTARRITVKLNKKTRNDDKIIYLLTNLPAQDADALIVAELYRKRWGIETAFQRLEAHFCSEINSLGYPKAALFGFCLALVAFNIYAVIMAALRAAYPEKNIKDEVSEYYIANEISSVYEGMVIAVDYNDWELFRRVNREHMAVLLIYLAQQVDLKKFKKHKRGEKKPKSKESFDKNHPHVSTFKLLLDSG